MCENLRTAKVFENNEWHDIRPKDIKNGMKIRLYEPEGDMVVPNCEGIFDYFYTVCDVYVREDGVIQLNVEIVIKE